MLLQSEKVVYNARGAGRKRKFTDAQTREIKQLRETGLSFAKIADKMGCSVGLIHKLINEKCKEENI